MTPDERVQLLLDQWEQARSAGRILSADELCRDCPELTPVVDEHIRALLWVPQPDTLVSDSPTARLHRFEPATKLGPYRLEQPLARGGSGQVWRAFDERLNRWVAVKVPAGASEGTQAQTARFLEEARRVARLRHPGIVPVYDVGQQDGVVFIVSELVEGETLAQRLKRHGPLPPRQAAQLVARVAESLHYAHTRGFVHRDVKPANILIDSDGRVFLTDFGIAVEWSEPESVESGLSGTLGYMAPEQARGRGEPVDPRTDIFALGVVLYELLTGRRPFQADSPAEVRRRILEAAPVPLRRLRRGIPRSLEAACLKALQKKPDDRFQCAAEFAEALRRALRREVPWPWVVAAGSLLFGLAGFLTAAVVLTGGFGLEPASGGGAGAATVAARRGSTGADGRDAGGPPASLPVRAPEVVEPVATLRGHHSTVSSVAFLPDDRSVLTGSYDRDLCLWDLARRQRVRVFRGRGGLGGVAVSPDGRRTVTAEGRENQSSGPADARIWNLQTGRELLTLKGHIHNVMDVEWHPSGRWVLTSSLDGTVRVWDAETGQELRRLGSVTQARLGPVAWNDQVWSFDLSPDGRLVLVSRKKGTLELVEFESGRLLQTWAGHQGWVFAVAFSPDGRFAASGSADQEVRLWDVRTGVTVRRLRPEVGWVNAVQFAPDGQTLFVCGQASYVAQVDVTTGRVLARYVGLGQELKDVAVSHDGRWLLAGGRDQVAKLWRVRTPPSHSNRKRF